jgi:ABC-type polysaccharide/polyol phosphate transport system ATPase subunit
MAYIKFNKVYIDYPVYGASQRSIKNILVNVTTGGILRKDESNHTVVSALDNISFEINNGDSIGVMGHNGAGKTTLLRAMAGLYKPNRGQVDISGSVSTVIELGAGLDSTLSGFENIFRLGLLYGLTRQQIEAAINDIEAFTELGEFLNSPISSYSSGMLMRLMFAVSTIKLPDILIVDEMFSTGDAAFQLKAEARMRSLIENSKIFIFASHSTDLIKKYCTKLFILNHGKLEQISTKSI